MKLLFEAGLAISLLLSPIQGHINGHVPLAGTRAAIVEN